MPKQIEELKEAKERFSIEAEPESNILEKLTKKQLKNRSREIEKQLSRDWEEESQKGLKLLLLGSADSGKSTFLRQLRLLNSDGFSDQERLSFAPIVLQNLAKILHQILNQKLDIGNEASNAIFVISKNIIIVNGEPQLQDITGIGHYISQLWSDPAIKKCLRSSSKYGIQDTSEYFMENANRILSNNEYTPTNQDIICCRIATLAITETQIMLEDTRVRVFGKYNFNSDVGGQKRLRQFWIPYFSDDVKAIIFITSLSSYDQFCEEDETLNRMVDSLQVFEKIISNKLLSKASMLVFLNKVDLFELKISHSPINEIFPDFTGKGTEVGKEFFKKKFLKAAGTRQVYTHFTQNTDTKVTAFVIASIQTIIVDSILKNVNFI